MFLRLLLAFIILFPPPENEQATNDLDEGDDVANEYNHADAAPGAGNEIDVDHTNIPDTFIYDESRCGVELVTSEKHYTVKNEAKNKATNDLDEGQGIANVYNHADAAQVVIGNEVNVEHTNIPDTFTYDESRSGAELVTSEQHSTVNNEAKTKAINHLDEGQDISNEYYHADSAHRAPGNEFDVEHTNIPGTFADYESRCGAESVTSEQPFSVNNEAKNKVTKDLDEGQNVANGADSAHGASGNEIDVEHTNIPDTFADDESICGAESVTSEQQSSVNNEAKNDIRENEKEKSDIANENVSAEDRGDSNDEYETSSVPDMKNTDIYESNKSLPQCAACCCRDSNYIFTLETETGSGTVHITNVINNESDDSVEEYNYFENFSSPNNTDICESEEANFECALCCCNTSGQFRSLETESALGMVNIRNKASIEPVNEEEEFNDFCQNFLVSITFAIIDINETEEGYLCNFCHVTDSEQNYITDAENIGINSEAYVDLWEDSIEQTAYDTDIDETKEEYTCILCSFNYSFENCITEPESIGNNFENIFLQNVFREILQTECDYDNSDNSETAIADKNERSIFWGSPHTDIQDQTVAENLNEIFEHILFSYKIQFIAMLLNFFYWRKG